MMYKNKMKQFKLMAVILLMTLGLNAFASVEFPKETKPVKIEIKKEPVRVISWCVQVYGQELCWGGYGPNGTPHWTSCPTVKYYSVSYTIGGALNYTQTTSPTCSPSNTYTMHRGDSNLSDPETVKRILEESVCEYLNAHPQEETSCPYE